jgi:hypothetical protein
LLQGHLGVYPVAGAGKHHQTLAAQSTIDAIGFGRLVVGLSLKNHVADGLHLIALPIPLATVCRQGIGWLLQFAVA